MSTQAETFQFRIKGLERGLKENYQHLLQVARDLRNERAINESLSRDVAKLNTIKNVLRT